MVLRLLRGEHLETVSREVGVAVAELAPWQETFIGGGKESPLGARSPESGADQVIGQFIARYSGQWLTQPLGERSPAQVRQSFLAVQEAA